MRDPTPVPTKLTQSSAGLIPMSRKKRSEPQKKWCIPVIKIAPWWIAAASHFDGRSRMERADWRCPKAGTSRVEALGGRFSSRTYFGPSRELHGVLGPPERVLG